MSVALLVALIIASNVVEVDSASYEFRDNDPLPAVAPPLNRTDDAFRDLGGMHTKMGRFIQELFIGATYLPKCAHQRVVEPVYYNYGQRVDLPCIVCQKSLVYSGHMMHWQFKPLKDSREIEKAILDLMDNKKEKVNVGNMNGRKVNLTMGDIHDQVFTNMLDKETKTQYFQRNGRLTIVNADQAATGFYRCTDETMKNSYPFLYYLVPNARIIKPDHEMIYFNLDWMYDGIDALYQDDTNFECKKRDNCMKYVPSKSTMPNISNEMSMFYLPEKGVANDPLGIISYIKWTPWSSCSQDERGIRTRVGRCMLKLDPKHPTSRVSGETTNPLYKLLWWILKLLPEGFRMFSGVLAGVFDTAYGPGHQRRLITWHFLESFVKDADHRHPSRYRCYHGADDLFGKKTLDTKYLYSGRDIFENERCPEKQQV